MIPEAFGRRNTLAALASDLIRQTLWDRDGGICQICSQPVDVAAVSFDRITPGAQGGQYEMANLQATHLACNLARGQVVKVGKATTCSCLRCGHSWMSVLEWLPKQCPRCHSVRWDRERRSARPQQPGPGGEGDA